MAMSLFAKAQLIVKSKLHTLLDKQVNTVEGYTQLIREFDASLADMRSGLDEAVAYYQTAARAFREGALKPVAAGPRPH